MENINSNLELKTRYLETDIFKKFIKSNKKVLLIKSGLGTGKTELIKKLKLKNVLVVTHRRSLANQIAERLGIVNYETLINQGYKINEYNGSMVISYQSLLAKNHQIDFNPDYVIIDEIDLLLNDMATTQLKHVKKNRQTIIETLIKFLHGTKKIIAMSGTVEKDHIKILEMMGLDLYIVNNNYNTDIKKTLYNNTNDVLQLLNQEIENGNKTFIATESKRLNNKLYMKYRKNKNVLNINVDSLKTEKVKKDFENFTRGDYKPDLVIYTNCIDSGLNLPFKEYKTGFFIAKNNIYTGQVINQMTSRFRQCEQLHGFIREDSDSIKNKDYKTNIVDYLYQHQQYEILTNQKQTFNNQLIFIKNILVNNERYRTYTTKQYISKLNTKKIEYEIFTDPVKLIDIKKLERRLLKKQNNISSEKAYKLINNQTLTEKEQLLLNKWKHVNSLENKDDINKLINLTNGNLTTLNKLKEVYFLINLYQNINKLDKETIDRIEKEFNFYHNLDNRNILIEAFIYFNLFYAICTKDELFTKGYDELNISSIEVIDTENTFNFLANVLELRIPFLQPTQTTILDYLVQHQNINNNIIKLCFNDNNNQDAETVNYGYLLRSLKIKFGIQSRRITFGNEKVHRIVRNDINMLQEIGNKELQRHINYKNKYLMCLNIQKISTQYFENTLFNQKYYMRR